MSYLRVPRLVFSGDFQADVSTVNNDVRHYDNALFESRFQTLQRGQVLNGWWNPVGTGAFRLIDVTVQKVVYADGSEATTPEEDPLVGLYLAGADEQVSAKLVDIDPQWQLASEIWGMQVRLCDSAGTTYLRADYDPAPFRDLYFARLRGAGGDAAATAVFRTVLTGAEWTREVKGSRFYADLKAAAGDDPLSISFTTFGFSGQYGADRFTIGKIVGGVGLQEAAEPRSFVLGRRFAPTNKQGYTKDHFGYFDAVVDSGGARLSVDLGNAVPLSKADGTVYDAGPLHMAVLKQADDPGAPDNIVRQDDTIAADAYVDLGEVDYRRDNWLLDTAGILDFALNGDAAELVADHPLALVSPGSDGAARVVVRETYYGLLVRADDFEHRMDPDPDAPAKTATTVYAAKYGKAVSGEQLAISLDPPMSGMGGGSGSDPKAPKAKIPLIGTPQDKIAIPATVTTGTDGSAEVRLSAQAPGNPRKYLDGQIYLISYAFAAPPAGPASPQQQFDKIVLHVRDAYVVPDQPTWDDIKPIMLQYANLYPIMSKRLFDIGDKDDVDAHRGILKHVFSLPMRDPNYMPATRDLSRNKLAAVIKYLSAPVSRAARPKAGEPVTVPRGAVTALAAEEGATPAEVGAPFSAMEASARAMRGESDGDDQD